MKKDVFVKTANFMWFQVIWWIAIIYQNSAVWAVCLLIIGWLCFSPKRLQDIKLMLVVFFIGTAIDSLLTYAGIFIFVDKTTLVSFWPIPIWLSLLWCAFAGTVYHSMTVFQGRLVVSALAGAIFAPISYIAGANLGAVELGQSTLATYFVVGSIWSIVFPFCFYLSAKIAAAEMGSPPTG